MDRFIRYGLFLVATALLYEWLHWSTPEAVIARRWTVMSASSMTQYKRIAVGLNSNLDLIVSGVGLLNALKTPALSPSLPEVAHKDGDLSALLGYSMQGCSAVERHFEELQRYKEIVRVAQSLPHEFFIGGNAALMAQKLTELTSNNTEVFLGGPVGQKLRALLDPRLQTIDSKEDEDEVHMILEYAKGETWGSVTAGCANRIIFSNDVANSELAAVDPFFDHIDSQHPELVIVSGAHLLDRFPEEVQQKKLDHLAKRLRRLTDSTVVHLELASIGNLELVGKVLRTLLPHLTSLGLNEQELTSAVRADGGPAELLVDMDPPEVGIVADMMHWLLTKYGNVDGSNPRSRLSRVHFHCLTFHVVAHASGAWTNANTAVFKGTEVAGRQACADEAVVPSKMQLRIPSAFFLSVQDTVLRRNAHVFDPNHPQVSWQRGRVDYHFSPVLVCKRPLKTVGLGDAISAVGLLYSQYLGAMVTGNV